ncbi:MAG: hypothetical protein U5K69_28555 [Balneolaceae bacterium]|nr:hypothetical protein [Balneolaceae bacterium]
MFTNDYTGHLSCPGRHRDQQIADFQANEGKEVIINLPGINQISIRGEDRDIVTVAELLLLRIQQTDLPDEQYSVQLTPRDSIIVFEEVEQM